MNLKYMTPFVCSFAPIISMAQIAGSTVIIQDI